MSLSTEYHTNGDYGIEITTSPNTLGYVRYNSPDDFRNASISFSADIKTGNILNLCIIMIDDNNNVESVKLQIPPTTTDGTFTVSANISAYIKTVIFDLSHGGFSESKKYYTDNWRVFIQ